MSELKASDLTAERFNQLTPTQAELLALLSEEGGEVVQIVGKILRHGLSSCHPDGGLPNYRLLESEIGDLIAATRLIASAGMIDMVRVEDAADEKLRRVFKYLHHSIAQPEPVAAKMPEVVWMTDELDAVLEYLEEHCDWIDSREAGPAHTQSESHHARACIAAVRAQAVSAQPKAVGVPPNVRELVSLLLWKIRNNQGSIAIEHYGGLLIEAQKEIDCWPERVEKGE